MTHKSIGPSKRKGVTELALIINIINQTSFQDCCFLESQLCWTGVCNAIRLTMTCNRYESGAVAALFIVRFPVSAFTENTLSVSPKENGKTIQSSDTFIKSPRAHWLTFSHTGDNIQGIMLLMLLVLACLVAARAGSTGQGFRGTQEKKSIQKMCVNPARWGRTESFAFPVPRPRYNQPEFC